MKTDPSISELLATGPEAFRVLSGGLTLSGGYRFVSLTLKGRALSGAWTASVHLERAISPRKTRMNANEREFEQ